MGQSKTAPKKLAALERRLKVWDLRIKGLSFEKISKALGCSVGTAHGDVKRRQAELEDLELDKARDCRALDNARLDEAIVAAMARLEDPDDWDKANAALCRTIKLKAELNGYMAPTRTEISGPDGQPITHGVLVVPAAMESEKWQEMAQETKARARVAIAESAE